jgi:glucokinase
VTVSSSRGLQDLVSPRSRGPVLALDLGATNARAAVVTPDGRVVGRQAAAMPMTDGLDAVIERCLALLQEARDAQVLTGGSEPIALGIAAPGPLDARTGVLLEPPNLRGRWWGFPLGPTLGDALGLPWAIGKDTNVAILAERDFGAGHGSGDLVYLTISTGIGGAAISGGRPVVGPDGTAGELGHMTVDLDGPVCGCGGVGHLEALASGAGIAAAARAALEAGADAPELTRIAARLAPEPLRATHVSDAAAAGDRAARVILERARRAVALAVVSIVNVFGPDAVILGGGITLAWGEQLLAPAREAVASQAFRLPGQRVRIVPAALGDDVGLIGTVPLVASALPGLVGTDDHQAAAARRAAAVTDRRGPGIAVRTGPATDTGSDAAGAPDVPAAPEQGAQR